MSSILRHGRPRRFTGYSLCSSGKGQAAPTLTAPNAPTSLIANAGDHSVTLLWTAPTPPDSLFYTAKWGTAPGGPYPNTATNIIPTGYTFTGLDNNATYYFVVTATNTGGESSASNEQSASPSSAGLTDLAAALAPLTPVALYIVDADVKSTAGGSAATADGSRVGQLSDIGGTAAHFTQAGAIRPLLKTNVLNARSSILFNGSTSQMVNGYGVSQTNSTLIVVMKPAGVPSGYQVIACVGPSGTKGIGMFMNVNDSGTWGGYQGVPIPSGTTLVNDTPYVLAMDTAAGGPTRCFTNGTLDGGAAHEDVANTAPVLGSAVGSFYAPMHLFAVVYFGRKLSDADRNAAIHALGTYYGITVA